MQREHTNRPLSRCLLLFYAYVDCPPDLILEFKVVCILFMLTRLGGQISVNIKA